MTRVSLSLSWFSLKLTPFAPRTLTHVHTCTYTGLSLSRFFPWQADTRAAMRFSSTLALTAAAAVAMVGVASATLDDCKWALNSLKEKPYSSSLPSMAASTGTLFTFFCLCCATR
jgi:hypothetical protein